MLLFNHNSLSQLRPSLARRRSCGARGPPLARPAPWHAARRRGTCASDMWLGESICLTHSILPIHWHILPSSQRQNTKYKTVLYAQVKIYIHRQTIHIQTDQNKHKQYNTYHMRPSHMTEKRGTGGQARGRRRTQGQRPIMCAAIGERDCRIAQRN